MRRQPLRLLGYGLLCLYTAITAACHQPPPERADPHEELIARGKAIFFNETFDGNGRTCGTCHREENNFTIDAAFIATLPDDDPLFVAEFNSDLKDHFENPNLMRKFGLILVNADGFDDLAHNFVLRGVPHTLGLRFSVNSELGPHTGWSGDGAPGDGSLRAFAAGAVIQHFPRTLNRVPGLDFRLPTDEELDALAAYQLSLGRPRELKLPLELKISLAAAGQEIFTDPDRGKCFICHFNGGATADPGIFGEKAGNLNFDTGIEDHAGRSQGRTGDPAPRDDGFGVPGDGTFNTPSLIEAADTGPFFHDNSIETIEAAIEFYNSDAFNDSPAGQAVRVQTGSGIHLDATQVKALAAFLRVINALENIRQTIEFLEYFLMNNSRTAKERNLLLQRAVADTLDAVMVLKEGGLQAEAVGDLMEAKRLIKQVPDSLFFKDRHVRAAIGMLKTARSELVFTGRP